MTEEHLTADLLKQLSAAARPEDYLLQGETIDRELSDYLNELRNDRGMKRAAVARESAVNETFVYVALGDEYTVEFVWREAPLETEEAAD